jgi:predicted RNA-binding Zn-ribbon protein involved in translation (DUF1610 family)
MKFTENIREVFKTLRRRRPTQIYCPRCGSPKIRFSSSLNYWLTPRNYLCENCGYVGPIVMELEKEESSDDAAV